MNTTKLIKTLALTMMASAAMLISGCSADDPLVENAPQITDGTVAGKAYTIPVTIDVTRQDDGTKATYNDDTRKLEFSAGDKLFVKGRGERAGTLSPYEFGYIAGTLDYVPETGKFSGSVTTNFEFEGTADALFKYMSTYFNMSSTIQATLLPAGYEDIGYLTVNRDAQHAYSDDVSVDHTKAFAGSKNAGIEQLSYEVSTVYDNGFALTPQNAILNFTVTDLMPGRELPAVFSYLTRTVNHNVTTNASGQATFAIGVENGTDFKDCSLTIAGGPITLAGDSKTLASGKIYNVNRYATSGPEGTVGGKFTINGSGDQVYFAKGNLRYVSGTWSFFDHQYECYSSYNADAWDKFGWVGESGNLAEETPGKWGVSTSTADDDYGTDADEDLANDWINIPDIPDIIGSDWHTLSGGTSGEWDYLLNTRSASTVAGVENARFAKAQVNGVHGLILFPDRYIHPYGVANPEGINETGDAGWDGNSYDVADWTKMEEAGCVFLPTAGYRTGISGNIIGGVDKRCEYWTTTHGTWDNAAIFLNVESGRMDTDADGFRYSGRSVRLVLYDR